MTIGVFGGGGVAYGRSPAVRESLVVLEVLFKNADGTATNPVSPRVRLQRARDNKYVKLQVLSGVQDPTEFTFPLTSLGTAGRYRISFLTGAMEAGLYNVEFLGEIDSVTYRIQGNIEIGEISRLQDLINRVRIGLMDDIPQDYQLDDNVHHWDPEQLYTYLREAVGTFNTAGPRQTVYALDSFPTNVDTLIVRGGIIYALYARARFEKANEMNYSDQHTLNIQRADFYKSMADTMLTAWKEDIKGYKQSTPPTPIGLRSQRVPFRVFRVLGMLPNHSSFFSA